MTRQNRTLSILLFFAMLVGSLPTGAGWALPVLAQETAEPAGALPEFPVEIVLGDQTFHYDREETRPTNDLVEVGREGEIVLLAESADPPYGLLFASTQTAEVGRLARYLAEIPVGPNGQADAANPCRAEPLEFGELNTGNGTYVFAGADAISLEGMTTVATTGDGQAIFGDPQAQPPTDLYLDTGNGLRRFVLLADGRPTMLGDTLQFQGNSFISEGEVTDTVDPATLTPAGCVGPFRVSASPEELSADGATRLYVTAGTRLFAYQAQEADPAATPSPDGGEVEATPGEEAALPIATAEPTAAVITTEGEATPPAEETAVATEEMLPVITDEPAAETEPGDAPLEVTVDDVRFALDRSVAIDLEGLQAVGEADTQQVYAAGDPPYQRVYRAAAGAAEAGRYLPELPIGPAGESSPENTCLAESVNFNVVDVGDAQYVYAGPEPDLTPASLLEVLQTSDGQPVYAEVAAEPFQELFFPSDTGLDRFILLGENGLPITVGETIAFAGQPFGFEGDVTGAVDPNNLVRAGCLGPFSVRADEPANDGAFDQIFIVLNDQTPRVLAFAAEAPANEGTSTPGPIETPAVASPAAIETPLPPTATAVPPTATATAIPPTATALPPTATAVPPTPTTLPTATAVPPTVTPAPPATTPQPVATEAPPATAEIPVATQTPVVPEVDGTPAAVTETPAVATSSVPPATDQVAPPEVFPTVAPPPTPFSAVPVDAPPPVPPAWPREIEVQGVRYTFDLEVDIDPGTLEQVDVVQAPEVALDIFASPTDQVGSVSLNLAQSSLAGPFGRVYAVSVETGVVARYVSQVTVTTAGQFDVAAPCSAEANPRTFSHTFDNQQYAYTFASVESSIAIEELRTATITAFGDVPRTDDGREILVRAGGYPGVAEVFVPDGETLERYIALNAAGVPVTLNNLVFAETQFRFDAQVSVTVESAGQQRIGCSGPFPLFAPVEQAEALSPVITTLTVIDNRVYQFTAVTTVIAPVGQNPPPPAIVPPPPGFVQITLETTINVGPLPTPLPNIRVVPVQAQPGATSTPASTSGLVAQAPEQDRRCQGDPGAVDANGLPERLPRSIQLSGVSYRFVGEEQFDNDVTLTRLGCVGPFEAVQADGSGGAQVVFLRVNRRADVLYRYEAEASFAVDFTVSGNARAITANDERYFLNETWTRSIYSSVTVIVYTSDADAADPARLFAVRVDGDVIAEYVAEGGDVVEAPAELQARAEELGINPDLVLGGGRRYLLVNLWSAIGTTTDGWVSLYSVNQEGVADTLLATDPRSLDLLIYRRSGAPVG
jgi:hypothetical protein